jgi:HEAT repeat protein
MLEQEFEALKTYDWGTSPKVLDPIEQAAVAALGDPAARKDLEARLCEVLKSAAPRAAKDYACRQLRTIGTATAVPALAPLLADEQLSHMARYALERIPAPEADAALRAQLPKLTGKLKLGVIASLGARRETPAVAPLAGLLGNADESVAHAAAHALGVIATPAAEQALATAKPPPGIRAAAVADSELACAEALLAAGRKGDAKTVYERLLKQAPPKPAKAAAELGLKACGAP